MEAEYWFKLKNLPYSHAFFYVGRSHLITEIHNEFRELFYIYNIFWIVRVRIDNLGASRYLQGLLTY